MKKATKQKCDSYILNCNGCNLIAGVEFKCTGDKCWLIKARLNTQKKLEYIRKLNAKMKSYNSNEICFDKLIETKIKERKINKMMQNMLIAEKEIEKL